MHSTIEIAKEKAVQKQRELWETQLAVAEAFKSTHIWSGFKESSKKEFEEFAETDIKQNLVRMYFSLQKRSDKWQALINDNGSAIFEDEWGALYTGGLAIDLLELKSPDNLVICEDMKTMAGILSKEKDFEFNVIESDFSRILFFCLAYSEVP